MKRPIILILFTIIFYYPITGMSAPKRESTVQFSYRAILDKSFKFETGREIPLTFEQSVENDGDISGDGNYFYYTSNRENGNYDIYIRNLKDITTVRLTEHPSKDITPAVSPDGKRLAFISFREDPEGDLYVMRINPEKIIKTAQESVLDLPSFDEKAKNYTQYQDPVTKTIKIIKDASPAWSPDGEWIAFSSTRDGMENIWRIRKNGADIEKLTGRGGMYPKFSPDGNEIIFISYRDKDSKGEVYIININNKQERRITNTGAIELYPTFLGNNNEIVYTLIDRDTNNDGKIDLKDNSVLYYKNLSTGIEYPITTYSQSSFNPRWINIFGSDSYKGILVYSEQKNDNININILPEIGIIPKSANASLQYDLAHKFITEFEDEEKFLMGLERVYHFFRNSSDNETTVFVTKALVNAAIKYRENKDKNNSDRIFNILKDLSKKGNIYTVMGYNFLNTAFTGGNTPQVLKDALGKAKSDKNSAFFIPYIMEDIGDNYASLKDYPNAIGVYRSIINEYGKYKRIISIHSSLARISELDLNEKISDSVLLVLKSGTTYQQFQMKLHYLNIVESDKDLNRRLGILGKMITPYEKNSAVIGLIYYSIGKTNFDLGRFEEAKKNFQLAAKNVSIVDIVYYRSNNYLGDIEFKKNRIEEAEGFYNLAVNRYTRMWKEKDIVVRIKWLINFYETYGERMEFSGNYAKASALYKKYYQLMSFLNLRRFSQLYNEYGARAHVLYIDAFSESKDNKNIDDLEAEYIKDLDMKKMDFDKAYIYGMGYVYAKKGIALENSQNLLTLVKKPGMEDVLKNFRDSVAQIDWALFLDDTFVDPYILKSWIYQYLDLKRNDETIDSSAINEYFPEYLWERNITLLEKTLTVNNEVKYKENEGNIHLNIANNYFLLTNYPRALYHYKEAMKYKKEFGSKIEEALFYFHLGYSYWQNGDIKSARNEINKSLIIYESLASGKNLEHYKNQIYTLYRYFALFYRMEENYKEAIKWYNRLIDFAAVNKLKVDKAKARYLQEIAYCYKELGNVDAAIAYLDKAKTLLAELTDDEQKYKLRFRVMGLFSFNFINLGQDAAVIGESKIYRRLDKKNNELLNIALHEEIYSDSGNYLKAVEYLQKKADLLKDKKSSIDKITMITTLNNQGYYYYMAGKFKEAREKFNQAWNYASDKDTNDLQGIFTSLINLSNLYAYLIENNIRLMESPQKDIEHLINSATKYRETYSTEKYKIELDTLEKKAKEKKEKVSDKEKEDLKKQVDEKAREIHYKIDISLGILKYYRILIANNIKPGKEAKSQATPIELYKNEKSLYDTYADILKKFETGLDNARRVNNRMLEAKLLINIGLLKSKLGDVDEANESYKNALAIVDKNRYILLQASLCNEYGYFLSRYGDSLEEGNNLSLSLQYYKKGTTLIEKFYFLFTGRIELVKSLYDRHIDTLIKMKQWELSLLELEKRHNVIRVLMTNLSAPEFFNKKDRLAYSTYITEIKGLERITNNIYRSLEKGESPESTLIKDLEKNLSDSIKSSEEFINSLERSGPGITPFLAVKKPALPKLDNFVIYSLSEADDTLFLFEIENGKARMKEFKKNDKSGYLQSLADYLGKTTKGIFIVLNDASLSLLNNMKTGKIKIPGFMFIPSLAGADSYVKSDNTLLNKIYFTGTGLQKVMNSPKYQVDEGEGKGADLAGYSIIIDGFNQNKIEPKFLFSTMLQSSLIIKNIQEPDADYLQLFMEAAAYSGIKTVIFTQTGGIETIKSILESTESKNFTDLNKNDKIPATLFAAGYSGAASRDIAASKPKIMENEFYQYNKNLKSGDIDKALIHLKRWNSLADGNENKRIYLTELADIEAIKEKYIQAKTALEGALKLAQPDSDPGRSITLKIIFLNYFTGDITTADNYLRKTDPGKYADYYDYQIYKSLQILFTKGIRESKIFYNQLQNKKFRNALPINKINLLYAEFISLFYDHDFARSILKNWSPDYLLNKRDVVKANYLIGSNFKGKNISAEFIKMQDMFQVKNSDTFIKNFLSFAENESEINSSYPILIQMAVEHLVHNNAPNKINPFLENFSLDDIMKKYNWLDTAMLLLKCADNFSSEGSRESQLSAYSLLLKNIESKNIPQLKKNILYQYSLSLAESGRYGESYNNSSKGEQILSKNDDDYIPYQLQLIDCETILNFYDRADKRVRELIAVRDLSKDRQFILNLLMSRIELNRLEKLKTASVNDAKQFDRIFNSSLDILDKHPEILKNFKNHALMNQIFDNYINFKMKTGNPSDALIFTEIKKQINLMIKFPSFQENRIAGLEKLKLSDAKNLPQSLKIYPQIQMIKIIREYPLEALQQKINEKSILIYASKVGNDIFVWALGKNYRNKAVLDKGYIKLKQILANYNDLVSKFNNTLSVSRDLENLFSPIKSFYDKKETIIFATDSELEGVPFEIMGSKNMLIETHSILYLSSIVSGLRDLKNVVPRVELLGKPVKIYSQLEKISLSESGIPFSQVLRVENGFGHINMNITYNQIEKDLFADNSLYQNIITNPAYIYIPAVDFTGLSLNEFSIYNSSRGISGLVINDSAVHDLNNAYFVDVFYKELNMNNDLVNAFIKAKNSIKSKNEFKHPAYWSGIRLYLNGL